MKASALLLDDTANSSLPAAGVNYPGNTRQLNDNLAKPQPPCESSACRDRCLGADLALPPAIQADVADWDRLRHRRDRTAGLFSLWNMATKLALAAAAGTALVVDLDPQGPAYPGNADLAELVAEGPTRRDLEPERSGVAVLRNGGVPEEEAAEVLNALAARWPAVVFRLPPRRRPDRQVNPNRATAASIRGGS